MISLLIFHILCCYIVSFNNRDTKDTQINTMVQTVSADILIQPDIIVPHLMTPVDGTEYSILDI